MNILQTIKPGYRRVMSEFLYLKRSLSDWIIALDTKQYNQSREIAFLKHKIHELEEEVKLLK